MRLWALAFPLVACGAGSPVFACSAAGAVQRAVDVTFTAAEAACLLAHATEGPVGAQQACGIEEERAPGVQVVLMPSACPAQPADAGQVGVNFSHPFSGGD